MKDHAPVADENDPGFLRTSHGNVVTTDLDNIRLGLLHLDAGPVFDEFHRDIRLDGRPMSDADVELLWVRFSDTFGWRPSVELLRRVLLDAAMKTRVHPVRAYLAALTWDGQPRLDHWLVTYGGAKDSPYVRAVGRVVLIAAVARVRRPGVKFDELLILEGAQGTFKSEALRALCQTEDWFSDDLPLGSGSKEVIERTSGSWIIEAAELYGNRGRESEALKTFLSRQVDGPVRLAYGRLPLTVPRQFVLIGTTNHRTAYLKDTTGARRFWPVETTQFNVDALSADRDQIWAEAAQREAAGESIRLDPSLWSDAALAQEARRAVDPWEAILEPLFDDTPVRVGTIWETLKIPNGYLDNRAADRVAAIAERFGLRKKKVWVTPTSHVWCWVRDEDGEGA